jgi:hypothetical protein
MYVGFSRLGQQPGGLRRSEQGLATFAPHGSTPRIIQQCPPVRKMELFNLFLVITKSAEFAKIFDLFAPMLKIPPAFEHAGGILWGS